jgi:hypothetical protein
MTNGVPAMRKNKVTNNDIFVLFKVGKNALVSAHACIDGLCWLK